MFSATLKDNFIPKQNHSQFQKPQQKMYSTFTPQRQGFFNTQQKYQKAHSQKITKVSVQNICNQIKYLIEGNLSHKNYQETTVDIVRDNIIPMLIKMFFENKADQKQAKIKASYQRTSQLQNNSIYISQSSNFYEKIKSTTNTLSQQSKLLKNNNFYINTLGFDSSQNEKLFVKQNKVNSCFINQQLIQTNSFDHNKQNLNNSQSYAKVEQNMKQKITQIIGQNQFISTLPQILCLTVLLIKKSVLNKIHAFEKINEFGKQKQNKMKRIIELFHEVKIKIVLNKFKQNKIQQEKDKKQKQFEREQKKFKQKTHLLSSQLIARCIKKKIKNNFEHLKKYSFQINKWKNIWIKYAALRSPITLKTSIWRLKNFGENEEIEIKNNLKQVQNKDIPIQNHCKDNNIQERQQSISIKKLKCKTEEATSLHILKDQIQQNKEITDQQIREKSYHSHKVSCLSASSVNQSQQISITSKQYEQMFKDQQTQQNDSQNHKKAFKSVWEQQNGKQKISQFTILSQGTSKADQSSDKNAFNQKQNNQLNLVFNDQDQYLRTISEQQEQADIP